MRCNVFLIFIFKLSIRFHQKALFLSWSWISTALTFNEHFKTGILELDNKTENYYNYSGAECSNTNWFQQIFIFFQNNQNQGQSTERKEKRKERNHKKKNQIRICLFQQYPIYKIKNKKEISLYKISFVWHFYVHEIYCL